MNEEILIELLTLRHHQSQLLHQLDSLITCLQSRLAALDLPEPADLDDVLATATTHQASVLYRHWPGRSRHIAAQLAARGWRRVRRERGIFWVAPTGLSAPPAAAPGR
jgi:hypothetical protein